MDSFVPLLAILSIFLLTYAYSSKKRPGLRPPGPKPLPIIGNLLDMPHESQWLVYNEWARKWGNLIMVSALRRNILIVGDTETALDLLESNSANTSHRAAVTMSRLSGWSNMVVEKNPDDPSFKVQRRMLHKLVGTPALANNFKYVQEQETQKLLQMILKDKVGKSGGDLMAHIKATTTSVVLRMGYGYNVKDSHDEYVHRIERMTTAFTTATQANNFLVNLFPELDYLPSWFPGTGFKKVAKQWKKEYFEAIELPYEFAKQQAAEGNSDEVSMTMRLLEEPEGQGGKEWEENVKYAMGILYSGGSDTTGISLYAFFKAMILYPEVQRRAQAEIDAVTGGTRLPCANDRPDMPYLNALVSEVMRWHPIAPLSQPHATGKDMEFRGYFIPKDTIILPNVWWMCYDPSNYRDPFAFNPERFLGKEPERDPRAFVFGFGRRICPGRFLGDNGVFLGCAMALAVFNILPPRDAQGNPILPDLKALSGLSSHPVPFEYEIKPRSKAHEELILTPV